eukprot:COSAG01_NODE_35193_length_535_cov_2.087156_2_plen_68_part_01
MYDPRAARCGLLLLLGGNPGSQSMSSRYSRSYWIRTRQYPISTESMKNVSGDWIVRPAWTDRKGNSAR